MEEGGGGRRKPEYPEKTPDDELENVTEGITTGSFYSLPTAPWAVSNTSSHLANAEIVSISRAALRALIM